MARPGPAARSHSRRSDELPSTDVFFDAGDALPEPDNASVNDPLGANRAITNTSNAQSLSSFRPPPLFNRSGNTPAYDFERPDYFPTATRRPPPSSTPTTPRTETIGDTTNASSNNNDHRTIEMRFEGGDEADDSTNTGSGSQVHRNGYSSLPTSRSGGGNGGVSTDASEHLSRSDRLRFALGRFGRFVGMGIPGARYSSLSQQDGARAGVHRPRVVGGGIGQDGVFANLSAKPERRRRGHNAGATDDRGDDDDLEDDIQPPTYEIAAADAVPQYWETTILGGSHHPLARGLGWTPGGAHVGAIEDLIVEGLAVGNFFGFAWNLLVSMTFQFVGFLLTYLLHTTHAARCGSRAGLGATLIQYGFYMRTRAAEIAEGKVIGSDEAGRGAGAFSAGAGAGNGWFGEDVDTGDGGGARRRRGWISRTVQPAQPSVDGATLADLFAAQADGQPVNVGGESISDSMSQSTEWFAYLLMVVGWTLLLSSMLSYWRTWRWGKSLVDAARREQESSTENTGSNNDASGGGSTPATGATGFINRFRSALSWRSGGSGRGSGEDWILFPGVGHRLGRTSTAPRQQDRSASLDHPTSIADLEDEEGLDTEDARLNAAERRLLNDMRRVGLA
ncbi:hypothetical protein [Sporisorium scitamineum]|uniref:Uncharacterized protein n=1 Tax=Sporisorium scitamineum TaxID=49012 RepID=A0A0F7S3D3_9BASI|nr:hypothetical protein [Sporisorium scitamineum]